MNHSLQFAENLKHIVCQWLGIRWAQRVETFRMSNPWVVRIIVDVDITIMDTTEEK
jgi:hypothetical protein